LKEVFMVSIKDVARLAGVSVATVSRSLARPEKVAIRTREKVMKAVQQSGYVTNVLASNFRRRKTQTIIVLVPDIANVFYSRIIQEIESIAREHCYQILLGETRQSLELEQSYGDLALRRQADGIISLGMHIPFKCRKSRKSVDPQWAPLVMVCEYLGGIPVPSVTIDNRRAAYDATQHLLELGHRDIAYIGGANDFSLSKDRLKGFKSALARAGLRAGKGNIHSGDFTPAFGHEAATIILGQSTRPTAIFCASDELAIGAMSAAHGYGLSIPKDLSIIGFDDIEIAAFGSPPLTTIRQPMAELGRCATGMMLQILSGSPPIEPHVILPHELVVRGSTASP
jgi:LacI family repressor for deo operon, udp, cdd, tsx, nupC, and nupG